MAAFDIVERAIDGGRVADVERSRLAGAAARGDPLRRPLRRLFVDVEADDPRTVVRAAERDRLANPRAGADDDRRPSCQIEQAVAWHACYLVVAHGSHR